jgi:hypothetical protein
VCICTYTTCVCAWFHLTLLRKLVCLDLTQHTHTHYTAYHLNDRYNDPGTLPPFRRNEVMVKLQDTYDPIWAPGELDAFTTMAANES